MRVYVITVDTYEGDSPFPILTHTFRGKTRAEAAAYLNVHKKTDQFFGGCTDRGRFMNIRCHSVVRDEGWTQSP